MSSELMDPNASFIRIENEKRVHHWLLRRRRIPRVFRFVGIMQRLFPMNCKKKQARQSLFFSFADPIVHLGQSFGLRVWPIYWEFPLRGSISSPRNFLRLLIVCDWWWFLVSSLASLPTIFVTWLDLFRKEAF